MNITTPITTGTIYVQILMNSTEVLSTTIVILPNTAPGALTAQLPLKRIGFGCTTGSQPFHVQVHDGSSTSGRLLHAGNTAATMTCRR